MDAGVNTRCGARKRLGGALHNGCGGGSVAASALGTTDTCDDRRARGTGTGTRPGGNFPQAAVLHVIVIVIAAAI